MKQILGLDVGTVTFTPGGAGVGTLVFAGITGFNASRVLGVSNVTRKALIYSVEVTGKGGAWSSLSTTGGTLTLDYDTTGHNAADVLRPMYQSGEEFYETPGSGRNLFQFDVDGWTVASGSSVSANVGPGPRPGSTFHRLTLAGASNQGLQRIETTFTGRGDGAKFFLSFWAKGSGTVNVFIRTQNASFGVNSFLQIVLTSDWRHYSFSLVGEISSITSFFTQLYGVNNVTTTLDISDIMLEQTEEVVCGRFAPYTRNTTTTRVLKPTPRTSVCMWGDSLINGSGGFEPRTELARLLNGSPVYNGGAGGETSTQIKTRVINASNAQYNDYGVVVIWAGRNNATDPATVLADIELMVAALRHDRFLVCSVTNNTSEPVGNATYALIATINAELSARYGRKFVDIRSRWCAGTATDIPNTNYMYDATHPNAVGSNMAAREIYEAIIRNGYMSIPPAWTPEQQAPRVVSAAFTRPADTTAYASGDCVANNTTAGNVIPLCLPLYYNRKLRRLRLSKTDPSVTNASFRVHLFGSAPTSAAGDNAAVSMTGAKSYLGYWDITIGQAFTDGASGWVDVGAMGANGRLPCTGNLFALLEARAAYTPANAEVFTLTAETDE